MFQPPPKPADAPVVAMFDVELRTYSREMKRPLSHTGEFVLIAGDQVVGIYPTAEAAHEVGYTLVGLSGFMVKQIQMVQTVHYFSRGGW